MNGRSYYLTTLGAWKRDCGCFASSHWAAAEPEMQPSALSTSSHILVLIEADEGTHAFLESHPHYLSLPHPLAGLSVGAPASNLLAGYGVKPASSTFDAIMAVGRCHPLIRYRVF